jgi:predicted permease
MFELVATDTHYPEIADKRAMHRLALERIRTISAVSSASGVLLRPFAHGSVGWDTGFVAEDQTFRWQEVEYEGRKYRLPEFAADQMNPICNMEITTPGFFDTMGIEFVEGRDFRESDDDESPHVLILSESLADYLWPGESALGKGLYVPESRFNEELVRQPSRVIGVVEDAHYREIDDIRFDIYYAYTQSSIPLRTLVVRTHGDPLSIVPQIRREIRTIAPSVPLGRLVTLRAVIDDQRAPWRFNAFLFTVLAAVAGLMTALGIFAVVSRSIVERRREIGVRMAIGARAKDVVRLSVNRSMKSVVLGIATGTAAALLLSRFIASLLYGVEPTDPLTYAASALAWMIVALLASYVPARRAARVDPVVALHHD